MSIKHKRNIQKLSRFSGMVVFYALPVEVVEDSIPSSFREAELSFESELRRNAMEEEIESLYVNETLLSLPKG